MEPRLYYVGIDFAVMGDPHNGGEPTIVRRSPGEPSEEEWKEIGRVVLMCDMILVGEPYQGENGLWCHPLKEKDHGEEIY